MKENRHGKGNGSGKERDSVSLWERYLTREIGIEFKACLYFFAILFFYCVYRLATGSMEAGILHMAEMILTCYLMGYLQVYALHNFDEAEALGRREIAGLAVCTLLYGALSFFLGWFDGKLPVTLGLMAYLVVTYLCVILIYRTKRRIDDKQLNEELALFKTEHQKVQDRG